MKIEITSLAELASASKSLIDLAGGEKIFVFYAKMGAGKTTFIKSIAQQLGVRETVSSPTFSIVNEYLGDQGQSIYHFDFYRIKSIAEVYDLGYEDYFYSGNICLIEWPEKIEDVLPDHYMKVEIEILGQNERNIYLSKI